MADPVLSAGISAGGQLVGGTVAGIGAGRENQRQAKSRAQRGETMDDFINDVLLQYTEDGDLDSIINTLMNDMPQLEAAQMGSGSTAGLEAQATRMMGRMTGGALGNVTGQGLSTSGFTARQNMGAIQGEVIGGLARDINQDNFMRQQFNADALNQTRQFNASLRQAGLLGAGGLTERRGQDRLARDTTAAEMYRDEAFGYYDPKNKKAVNTQAK